MSRLRAAGYDPEVQAFEFPYFEELAPARLLLGDDQIATGAFTYSGSGTVTGRVVPVDLTLPPPPTPGSTSGCEASDFAGLDFSGDADVALVQRGTCTFQAKAENAQAAGAEAVVIFNEGQPGRTDLIVGTLGEPSLTIPVVGASFADGVRLEGADAPVTVSTRTISERRTTWNVLAQTSRGDTDNVVMAGAHLDSVLEGPGINDNGSGSAGLLEIAEAMAKVKPENAVRFAWWGAEELGLLGAEHYVSTLSEAQLGDIALYLNFDMIASRNPVRFVYDGDDSDGVGAGAGPAGSGAVEDVFRDYFAAQGLPTQGNDFTGRSDYGPFIAAGIPAGGLFTGAEELKTAAQARLFGGVAGAAYDPCYHEACDNLTGEDRPEEHAAVYAQLAREYRLIGNVNMDVFEENIDAIAHAVLSLAYDTSSVNGVAGASGNGRTKVRGPGGGTSGGSGDGSGGGLHDDHEERPAA